MQPQAHEGTHKDPATEVWVYNAAAKTRIKRLRLARPGSSISITHGAEHLLLVQAGRASRRLRGARWSTEAQLGFAGLEYADANRARTLMTTAASMLGVIQALVVQLAAFQAVLLLASGLHKLIRRHRTQAVVHEFARVPRYLAPFAVGLVAAAELFAGLLLLTPSHRAAGGVLAALIWGAYLLLILRAIAQGRREVDCGCTFGAARRPLGRTKSRRNAVIDRRGIARWRRFPRRRSAMRVRSPRHKFWRRSLYSRYTPRWIKS